MSGSSTNDFSFGLFLNAGEMLGDTHQEVFAFAIEQARLAETLGYDDVWVTEHHFIPFGINSNALTLAGFLLGKFSNIRVGTAVTLAPQYSPVQLAEQVAILDQVSQGRLDFGIGRGGYRLDFDVFDIPYDRWDSEIVRTAEQLEAAWSDRLSEVNEAGPKAAFRPNSYSSPQPPLFLATASPDALRFAAERELSLLHYFATPFSAREKVQTAYKSFLSRGVDAPEHVHTLIAIVCDDPKPVREQLYTALLQSFADGDWPGVPQQKAHVDQHGKPIARDVMARGVADRAIVGNPEDVADDIWELRTRMGATRIVINMECIGEKDITLRSIQRFAEEVRPLLRKKFNSQVTAPLSAA
ncbi:MAG: LLM class flavin-dependent oxidoreductase [Pseudomonadota bacterium]